MRFYIYILHAREIVLLQHIWNIFLKILMTIITHVTNHDDALKAISQIHHLMRHISRKVRPPPLSIIGLWI